MLDEEKGAEADRITGLVGWFWLLLLV